MRSTALRVGRGKDNDLELKNDSVSRHHAEIHRTREGDFTITELNSGNGVLVNGQQVTKTTLKNDDIIELGEVRIRFLIA
jgi:pSer/pThr/pTyr-binding forkhead associated (FHA) protein